MKIVLVSTLITVVTSFTAPLRVVNPAISTSTLYAVNGDAANGDAANGHAVINGAGVNGAAEKKKIIVLGGDGFCGWPTSLYLSDQGHDIVIVDNLSRRNIDNELGCDSLTPIQSPEVSS